MNIDKYPRRHIVFSLSLWILTMIVFVAIPLLDLFNTTRLPTFPLLIWLYDLLMGISLWVYFVWSTDRYLHIKYRNPKAAFFSIGMILSSLLGGIGFILLLFVFISSYAGLEQENQPMQIAQSKKYQLIRTKLRLGSVGDEVQTLQAALSTNESLYPQGIVNGYYGSLTEQAVRNFQAKNDLPQTGEMDEQTINTFNKEYGDKPREYYVYSITSSPTYSTPSQDIIVPSIDYDPIVNCNIHPSCGGGTKQLQQSVCNQSICCQIGSQWLYYPDKNKCTQDQDAYYRQAQNNSYPTYSVPTFAPLPTWAPLPTYDFGSNSYPTNTPTAYIPQITKEQCQVSVRDSYNGAGMQYGCSFPCPDSGCNATTSVCDALWYSYQKDMGSCNQYP